MKKSTKSLALVAGSVLIGAILFSVIFIGLANNNELYLTPLQIAAKDPGQDQHLMVGGTVKLQSFNATTPLISRFVILGAEGGEVAVDYQGILPNMFAEGEGVAVRGRYIDDILVAQEVLVMHGEAYTPAGY